jgi:NADP-reducing hydrogenase subunit HndD
MCVVEIEGRPGLHAACFYPVEDGMVVHTNTARVFKARRSTLELILSEHDRSCLTCIRNQNCELQMLARDFNVDELPFDDKRTVYEIDDRSPAIVRDNNKCVLCRRCIAVCKQVQETAVIDRQNRGIKTRVGCAFEASLDDVACIMCGQCIISCPTGALSERDHTQKVWDALADPDTYVIAQTAPAVRVALGEEFGMPIGSVVTAQMVHALRKLGFNKVFDTNTAADITVMEEGTELIERLEQGGVLPLFTSCSPGWVKFLEQYYPSFIPHLSSCKSPHQMFGALIKDWYAQKAGIDPASIFVVSVMPCTAKKYEIGRPEMEVDGLRDVDAVLTTRELAKMIRTARINWNDLATDEQADHEGQFDNPFGEASGAGALFGASGGVTEAALRTVAELMTGTRLEDVEFAITEGKDGIREYTIDLEGFKLKGAVVNGTGNAKRMLERLEAGEADYQFIEFMGCPGGCIMGGGQPIVDAFTAADTDIRKLRAQAIQSVDRSLPVRRSHENPFITKLYADIGGPGKKRAHRLFHTTYTPREQYPTELRHD